MATRRMSTLCLLWTVLLVATTSSSITETTFLQQPLCSVSTKITSGCMQVAPSSSPSTLGCARLCSEDNTCVAASVHVSGTCYLHQECGLDSVSVCTEVNDDDDYKLYSKVSGVNQVTETTDTTAPEVITQTTVEGNAGTLVETTTTGAEGVATSVAATTTEATETCENHGTWRDDLGMCQCINLWCGVRCERKPFSCHEVYYYGHVTPGLNIIVNISLPGSSEEREVICSYDRDGDTTFKTYILTNREDGAVDFYKTWEEYKAGWQDNMMQMFVGLDTLYALNQAGYTNLSLYVYTAYMWKEITYSNFVLQDESGDFSFTLTQDSVTVHAGADTAVSDCLALAQGRPFSTHDHQTETGENCAVKAHSGWWFSAGCDLPCNLLGLNAEQQAQHDDKSFSVGGIDPGVLKSIKVYFTSSTQGLNNVLQF